MPDFYGPLRDLFILFYQTYIYIYMQPNPLYEQEATQSQFLSFPSLRLVDILGLKSPVIYTQLKRDKLNSYLSERY